MHKIIQINYMDIVLQTEGLFLRKFVDDDIDNLFWLDSHPEIIRWGNGGNTTSYEKIKTVSLPKAQEYYQKYENMGIWAAIETSSQSFMGWFHYFPAMENKFGRELNIVAEGEIALGYRLHPDFWGRGYATQMSAALISQGFSKWGVQKVVAWTLSDNHRSIRVMEKVGLLREREFEFTPTQLPNLTKAQRQAVKYGLSKDNYQQ